MFKIQNRALLSAAAVTLLLAAAPAHAAGRSAPQGWSFWAWLATWIGAPAALDSGPFIDPLGRNGSTGESSPDVGPFIDPLGRNGSTGENSPDSGPFIDPTGGGH